MGLFDKLLGKKPAPVPPTPEELAAKEAQRLDNAVWAAGDAMNYIIPQIVANYRSGAVKGFDPSNHAAERIKVDAFIGEEMAAFHASWPAAGPQFDEVQAQTVESIMRQLPTA